MIWTLILFVLINNSTQFKDDDILRGNMLFSKAKNAHLKAGEWSLILPINADDILKEIKVVRSHNQELHKIITLKGIKNGRITDVFTENFDDSFTKAEQLAHSLFIKLSQNFDIQSLSEESKRHLLSFLGEAIAALTDLPSRSEFRSVVNTVNSIRGQSLEIAHALSETITVINTTQFTLNKHQEQINVLTERVNYISDRISNDVNNITAQVDELNFIHKVDKFFQNQDLKLIQLDNLITSRIHIVTALSMGKLSEEFINPSVLMGILSEISNHLPNNIMLPFDLDVPGNIIHYYTSCKAKLLLLKNELVAEIQIPLKRMENIFEIYSIIPIAFPHEQIGAEFHITTNPPFEYLGIDRRADLYFQLNQKEFEDCTATETTFCSISKPFYRATNHNNCIINMLMNKEEAIETCNFNFEKSTLPSPTVLLHSKNNYVLSATEKSTMQIQCESSTYEKIIPAGGITHISLSNGCGAYNNILMLPKSFHKNSSVSVPKIYSLFEENFQQILAHVNKSINDFDIAKGHLKKLEQNEKIDLKKLKNMIEDTQHKTSFLGLVETHRSYIKIGMSISIVLILIGLVYVGFRKREQVHLHPSSLQSNVYRNVRNDIASFPLVFF